MGKQVYYTDEGRKCTPVNLSPEDEAQVQTYMANMPKWLVGCHVDWCWTYDNDAYLFLHIKCLEPSYKWDERWKFVQDPKRRNHPYYMTESGDGRARFHYAGPLYQSNEVHTTTDADGNKVQRPVWQSQQSEGYGGRHFPIEMEDGRYGVLRGPWHGCGEAPYQEVSFKEVDGKYPDMGYYGLAMHTNLIIAAQRTFLPQFNGELVHPKHVPHFIALRKPSREKPTIEDASVIPNWELYQ